MLGVEMVEKEIRERLQDKHLWEEPLPEAYQNIPRISNRP